MTMRRMANLSRLALIAAAAAVLAGCSGSALFPRAGEPDRTELSEWQNRELLNAALAAVPRQFAESLPSGQAQEAARFLARALETAPDGQRRQWRSADRTAILSVRPTTTTMNGGSICRDFDLGLESPAGNRNARVRACRSEDGLWVGQPRAETP